MPVEAHHFIAAACDCCDGEAEIDWRNAMSRAYYGAFHWAQRHEDRCRPLPHHVDSGGSHEKVIRRYEHHGENAAKAIAYVLTDLKNKRKVADYQLDQTLTQQDAKTQVAAAQKVVERISTLFQISPTESSPVA